MYYKILSWWEGKPREGFPSQFFNNREELDSIMNNNENNKGKIISIRFTDYEYEQLIMHASKKSLKPSTYIKRCLLQNYKNEDSNNNIISDNQCTLALKGLLDIQKITMKGAGQISKDDCKKILWRCEGIWDALQ